MEGLAMEARHRFRNDQYLGPVTLMSPAEMAELRSRFREVLRVPGPAPSPTEEESQGRLSALVAQREGASPVPFIECRHLDSPDVYGLCTHPRLLEVARALYGEDLLIWRSTIIEKGAGGPEFEWHQDWGGVFGRGEEYGLEPPLLFTFWIALTEATADNGCLRFLPGIRRVIPGVPTSLSPKATLLVPKAETTGVEAVSVPLRPGQCVVFTDRAVHASGQNSSGMPRLGLAVRFTLPAVRVRPHFPGHGCVLASGRDSVGINRLLPPPTITA